MPVLETRESRAFSDAVRPVDRRPPWQWAEDHVQVDHTSPLPGRWRSDNSPWVRPLMEAFSDNRVRDIAVQCSAQSSKTQTLLCLACWAIAEDPGPALWVTTARDEAKDFIRDRVGPTFANCLPVARLLRGTEGTSFIFPTMSFYFSGAGSKSKLQSKPVRWLFLDEVRNYRPGRLEMVLKRTRSWFNCRRVLLSTAGNKNDAMDRAFRAGDQRTFHFRCPACQVLHPLRFDLLKWDTNEITRPAGVWDHARLADTIRLECPGCQHTIRDTPGERRRIAASGCFVPLNPKAEPSSVSFTWNALLPPLVPWRAIVSEFLAARQAAAGGDMEPLRSFVTETLGEPWEDRLGEVEDFAGLVSQQREYAFDDTWPEERLRFLTADKQAAGGEHYWWAVRAFAGARKSRLLAYGCARTEAELVEAQRKHRVPSSNCWMDSGFDAPAVYRFCVRMGWKAVKGVASDLFTVQAARKSDGRVRSFWWRTAVDPAMGTALAGRVAKLPLFIFSDDAVKDLLAEQMTGLVGEWTIPHNVGREYLRQVTSERREERADTNGQIRYVWVRKRRDNHLFDCEKMLMLAAYIAESVSRPTPPAASAGTVPETRTGERADGSAS